MSVYFKEAPEYLRQAIESIQAQTFPTDDFVLVCDGPLNDALDAAIAEKQQEKQKRLIWLYVTREKQFVRIRTENYCDEKIHFKNGMPVTTKKDRRLHGYGMKSIKSTVEKYHGSVVAAQENNWFELKILLPAGR